MTKQTEALKMAIGALTVWHRRVVREGSKSYSINFGKELDACSLAIKEALAQPAQEPVAWQIFHSGVGDRDCEFTTINPASLDEQPSAHNSLRYTRPLYTHPAPSWQGLSDDENKIFFKTFDAYAREIDLFARAIEQALKEKNNAM